VRHRWSRAAVPAVLATVLAGLCLGLVPQGASGAARSTAPVRPIVTGWLPYWGTSAATSVVTANAGLFREASPFFFTTTSATGVRLQGSSAALQSMTSTLHARGIAVIPTFTTTMDADRFAAVLRDRSKRREHVRALVRAAVSFGVDGVDLDYESINFGSRAARDLVRAKYPVLLDELDAALAARGMVSSVTVPARRSDADPNWWVYDYGRLGSAVDRFRIMTYDYSWSGGSPGPIAPKSWVRSVVAYAVTRVAPSKISFGLPSYGRDWFTGTVKGRCPSVAKQSTSRTSAQMASFARSRSIAPRWNRAGTSRTFTYRQRYTSGGRSCVARREAWFDDARSFRTKLGLVAQYQLRGVAVWALGNETAGMWRSMHRYAAAVAVKRTSLSVNAPARVVYGSKSVVRGKVRVDGVAESGVRVTLWRRGLSGSWGQVATRSSGAAGQVGFAVAPRRHTQYQLRNVATWAASGARSAAPVARVAYRVALDRLASRVTVHARQYVLRGTVAPGLAGVVVHAQLRHGGRWVTRGTATVGSGGQFALTVRVRQAGDRTVRVLAAPGVLDAGASRAVGLSFR